MTYTRQDIQEKVVTIVAETLHTDKANVTPQATFEKLGADSLDMLEIVMKLEEAFNIEIPDDQAGNIQTVGQAIDKIAEHHAAKL